jgi:8-amino-3,8-dideoxy-alpha-D-manno-octulosonate transaminase
MPGYELIGEEEEHAVSRIFGAGGVFSRYGLDSRRQYINRVDLFEEAIRSRFNVKYALCVNSGTAALKLALIAAGVKPGDEVITQSYTFIATVEAILELGAIPVIVNVNSTLNMDILELESKITGKTKAIVPVHMNGVACQMDGILQIAESYDIPVIEDSCQAMGGMYKDKHLGTIGLAGAYSMDIGKIITTGEGGILVTNDEEVYKIAREYADHGHEQNSTRTRGQDTARMAGFNYKVTEFIGAIGLAQLKKIDYILKTQRENKRKLKSLIISNKNLLFRDIEDEHGDTGDSLIFFVKSEQLANEYAKILAAQGVGTKNLPDALNWHFAAYWPHIFNKYDLYVGKRLDYIWGLSATYLLRAVAIPIMVNMTDERIEFIGNTINEMSKD